MASAASESGRALAARRPRTTIVCEICGAEKEVWAREKQKPRTCSPRCRVKLHRQAHKQQEKPMPKTSKWQAQHIGCQAAVDSVRAELTARVERLEARLQIATGALEYIAERNYTGGATVAREALAKLVAS